MKKFIFIVCSLAMVLFTSSLIYADTGEFGKPFNENQSWLACGSIGWQPMTQYHMQWNDDINPATGLPINKYHMGEDWNGQRGTCDGNSDEGAPLLAISDGQVVFIDDSVNGTVEGQGKRLYIRYTFPYTGEVSRKITFDSAYYHLNGMASGIVWTSGVPNSGSVVTLGQTVAYLGKTGTASAHLHWEAQTDLTIPLGRNPYQNPLTVGDALKYRAPSLIVDDHEVVDVYSLVSGQYYFFTMSGNAPGSIAYFKYGNELKTIKDAISEKWIGEDLNNPEHIYFSEDGGTTWQYYIDTDDNFFENGVIYAIYANVSGLTFEIPVPRNQFQPDRARLDMLHAVENDSNFESLKTETYGYDPNWTVDFELHTMAFNVSTGGYAYVAQATSKSNPLIRHTCYYNPITSSWTPWQFVGWNNLY